MKIRMLVLFMLAMFVAMVGCKKTEEPAPAGPAKGEPAKTEPAKTEPAAEPAKTEPAAEPAAEPAPAAGGSPCEAYAACCAGYVDALSKVEGMPAQALEGAKQGCAQIEQLKGMGAGADQACTQALAAMKQGAEAYKAMPGFVMPDACK